MKKLCLISAALIILGCSTTPPTKTEQALFNITTNYVPVLTLQTNIVDKTNIVVVPVYTTNVLYTYDVKTNGLPATLTGVAATIGNIAAPGVGGPIAGAVIPSLLAIWAWVRGSKKSAVANNLAQSIETTRQLIKTLPNGPAIDDQLTSWMQQHQAEVGVLPQVLDILDKTVDTPAAKEASDQIRAALATLQNPRPPGT